MATLLNKWFGNIKGDVLAGIVVALALIPEAISFSIIAGVRPDGWIICILLYSYYHCFCWWSSCDDYLSCFHQVYLLKSRSRLNVVIAILHICIKFASSSLKTILSLFSTWLTISTCCNHFDRYYPDHNGRVKTRKFNKSSFLDR